MSGERPTIQARFERFHRENPEVYEALVRLARRIKASGVERYSIAGLYEVVRYDRFVSTKGEPYKLQDNYKSRYARLIMENEPELDGFFRTKELKAP